MKYKLAFLLLGIALNSSAIDKLNIPSKGYSCAIRVSNEAFNSVEPPTSANFCSGSIVENGSMIVFAAHCLNQILEKQSDFQVKNSFEVAYLENESSEKMHLNPGEYVVFAGDLLGSVAKRNDFLQTGDPKYIKDDLAIVKLKVAIPNYKNCPALPSLAQCEEFEKKIISATKEVGLYADFFISNQVEKSSSAVRKVLRWYPSNTIVQGEATEIAFSPSGPEVKNLQAPILVSFSKNGKEIRMRRGDSGSVAYWKHNSGNLVMGVQSATVPGAPEKGFFSQICKHVGTDRFEDFLNIFKANQSSAKPTKANVGAE